MDAQHTRYMNDNQPVCEDPARLDDFDTPVIVDFNATNMFPCKDCNAALMAHNQKAYEDELAYDHNFRVNRDREDPLSPARGIMYGCLLSSFIWVILLLILWAVFVR